MKRWGREIYSVKDIPVLLGERTEDYLVCQFIDDFGRLKEEPDAQRSLIADEPEYDDEHRLLLCKLASLVKMLASDNGLAVPAWTFSEKYIYPEPYYSFAKMDKVKRFLFETTPEPFRSHNLFIGEGAFSRM
jgi:hypothetical protein